MPKNIGKTLSCVMSCVNVLEKPMIIIQVNSVGKYCMACNRYLELDYVISRLFEILLLFWTTLSIVLLAVFSLLSISIFTPSSVARVY